MEGNFVTTEHKLDFEVAEWNMPSFTQFRIGTCHGLWRSTKDTYDILAIDNDEPGNGHLEDVFQWFESCCKRDKRDLMVLEVWNADFMKHLLTKRGFTSAGGYNVIKRIYRK